MASEDPRGPLGRLATGVGWIVLIVVILVVALLVWVL